MKVRMPRKRVVVVVATAMALALGGGVAYAYWTAGGSGTGTVTVGANDPITVNQTSVLDPMAPGVAAQTLSGNFDNANAGPVQVASVAVAVSGTSDPGCTAADFAIVGSPMTVGAEVPVGTGTGAWSGATIAFNDNPVVNQNLCKNVTVTLAYTAS